VLDPFFRAFQALLFCCHFILAAGFIGFVLVLFPAGVFVHLILGSVCTWCISRCAVMAEFRCPFFLPASAGWCNFLVCIRLHNLIW
jgi:hypothetical protein